ncbi:MAG: UDP-3-O-acyl-N-acetylglucosamine deacetylase [Veillonellaceae bacterium]|nr:UDP-3-O-acyl-N-acetylglucosamine deacetylase [Veillonellaceae bacterium]
MQHTIARAVSYEGIGLHSGVHVQMRFLPAPPDTGILFRRTDLATADTVRAHVDFVTDTLRATTLENGPVMVATVEHVLSGLAALAIDNCIIELSAPEPPVGDGSAAVFVALLDQAGREEQPVPRRILRLQQACSIYENEADRYIAALPYDGLRVTFISEKDHPLLRLQVLDLEITEDSYRREIMRARTIGFTDELEALRAMGLGKGGTLENAVVYSATECLSELRFPDEVVRHKILDVIGDLSLAGSLHAHIIARKSGHRLNTQLAALIAAQGRGM